jgi:hypothetical protein
MKIGGPPIYWEPILVDMNRTAATLYAEVAETRG